MAGRPLSSTPSARGRRSRIDASTFLCAVTDEPAGRSAGLQTDVCPAEDRDKATTWGTRLAQYDAVCAWAVPDHAMLQRLSAIRAPTFIANGDSDRLILPHYSYLLAGLIPHARIKIYSDWAHGFLFLHHADFAADVDTFLSDQR
jgi:pimeloyl-ACP methyl ester carboxylesterase